jgi:glucosamine--fructose-6-phosphate aminotransferase (isomerizing)
MDTLLHQEIFEQPQALGRFLQEESAHVGEIARQVRQAGVTHVVMAARGTSDNAATYGRYLLESFVGLPVSLAAPSIYTLYKRPPSLKNALVIGISQSGEGLDVTEVVAQGRAQGAFTLAITNNPASPLAQSAEHVILCHAGLEKSVAATKTYTSQLYALAWLGAHLGSPAGIEAAQRQALTALPDQMARTLELDKIIQARAERYRYAGRFIVVGRGFNYATAFEVALKLKELTYLVAEPYSSADFRHGPIAIVEPGFPILVIAPSGATLEDMRSLVSQMSERQAELLIVADQAELLKQAEVPLPLPVQVEEWVSPLLCVIPGQLLAYHLTLAKGYDPDQPRTLHKVTITR